MKTIIVGILVYLLLLLVVTTAPANSTNPYLDAEIAQPFGGQNSHGTFAWEQDRDIWLKKKSTKRKVIKKRAQIKKLKKKAEKPYTTKQYVKKYVEKQRAKKRARKKEFYEVKPKKKIYAKPSPIYDAPESKPQIKAALPPPISNVVPTQEELYEEPTLLYDPEADETPLLYNEGPGVVKPYQLSILEKIREWWNSLKRTENKEELDFLTQKKESVSIVSVVKDWYATAMAKFVKKKVEPEKKIEVAEVNPCGVIRWMVPDDISSIGLRILNRDGTVASQFTISNYITVRPGQSFQLVPRCQ